MEDNRVRILKFIGVGVPVAISLYLLYRYLKGGSKAAQKTPQGATQINQELLRKAVQELKEEMTDQPISQQENVIKGIFQKSHEIIKEEFVAMTQHYRKVRRQIKDPQEKVKSAVELEAKVKELKQNSLNCLLARLDIPENVWTKELFEWLTAEKQQQWRQLMESMQDVLDQAMPVKSKLPTKKNLHEIFQHHIKFLQGMDPVEYGLNKLPQEQIIVVVNHIVEDQLFKIFKVEKEGIRQTLESLTEQQYEEFSNYFEEILNLGTGLIMNQNIPL